MSAGKPIHPQDLPPPTATTPGGVQLSGSSSDVYKGDGTWGASSGGGGFTFLDSDWGLVTAAATITADLGTVP